MTMDSNNETPEKTTDDRFKDDPEAIYRIYSIISYFVVLVIIGIPVWWFTTRVYRAPLPLDEMLDYDISHKIIRENSIPLSLEYDVLITILNPDPRNLTVELDGKILKANLDPFLKTISSVANFTVKSQWLYLTELGVPPKMIDKVDSNAFLNPRWGGISIINADKESCIKGTYTPDIARIISIYITQLKDLIGLRGTTEKDIDDLAKTKSVDMITSTRRTLKSLALLLSEINSIVISEEVAQKIKLALENVNKADGFLNNNDLNNALQSSKLAYYNSEGAFSDPSLLALLYFPDDQKYAIYIPLFLPIMIPVFMSLTTLRKWYTQEKIKKQKVD
ncbi:gpi transamidase component pig-s [Holotrichia oblita]|uniref:Gpi transamidase component pig-s n=1 Tax=Holotrichia oblita TaxID=644536 RepID=A0ACB9TCM1_HOLOL|nr:gpi transamidase component pig-s [Holotrichia oblita]